MLHHIPIQSAGPRGAAMAHAVESCIHCGFCLPTCPTYELLGDEADSPRGRIILMKEVLEGTLDAAEAAPHIDRCLGCVACQTHCPSGVEYGNLLSAYRSLDQSRTHSPTTRAGWLRRKMAAMTLPYPMRFRFAMKLGQWGRKLQQITPEALRPMLALVPDALPARESIPQFSPAIGTQRGSVLLHLGCAARVLRPSITSAAIRVLNRNGIAVRVPQSQACCGALHWHIGDAKKAMNLASANLLAFAESDDPILTTAAGCGSGMHEYPLILAGEDNVEEVAGFAGRVLDISVYLDRIGLITPPALESVGVDTIRVGYHDACHLAHAQKIRKPPRSLLQKIEGLELVEIAEADWCCGSAGTYNIDQPELASQLGKRKADNIIASGCDVVAMGNIGCQVQIEMALKKAASDISVLHTIELLDHAYRGTLTREQLGQPQ